MSSILPENKDVFLRADGADIFVTNLTCVVEPAIRRLTITADIFNKNKSSFGVVDPSIEVTISKYGGQSEADIEFKKDLKLDAAMSKLIIGGSVLKYNKTIEIDHVEGMSSFDSCRVKWSLTRPGWIFDQHSPFGEVTQLHISE